MSVTTFQQFLQSGFSRGVWSTDEVVEFVLPLFEEVLSFHEKGVVGSFEKPESIFLTNGRLDIDENYTHSPSTNNEALKPLLDFQTIHGYTVTGRKLVEEDLGYGTQNESNLQIETNPNANLVYPVYVLGYQCYEFKVGHHDAQSDIFCLGLILGSVIMGLNLYETKHLEQFAAYRLQPAGLNSRMHPTLCALVTEMTELNRKDRTRDLQDIILRLKYYRDYDPQRQSDLASLAQLQIKHPGTRKAFVLSKLRNRLFDTSRRNRLLYYKPNSRFVNLTVSSVPMVLHFQSIKPELLFTWNDEISRQIIAQKDIPLNKYLRFEDHPYLNAQLNGVRQISDSNEKEYGFSQLKLVVAFLHWHNLKDDITERIQSPILLLPVKLKRNKSLKEERFALEIIDNSAIINPVLSNFLKDLYGIQLPESIDFDDISMEQFFQMVKAKIDESRQGVKLNYIDKPRIKLVHTIAKQTINNYKKKLKHKGGASFHNIEYSYSEDNYRPLGLELFRQKIEPKASPLEFLLSEIRFSESPENFSETKTNSTFQLTDGESNPYSWDFDICNIVLGNFNYKKMSLVSDYNIVNENDIDHPVFNELFSQQPRQSKQSEILHNPDEWYHVITADPTQTRAVLHNRSGNSYIIQGPPGTGKSQTITNLIADFLARNKTILFICEKRAALDVVYHRLKQNNLSELCCYIHDSQGDKKAFVKDLREVYEDFLKNKMNLSEIENERKNIVKVLIDRLEVLKSYHDQQCANPSEAGIAVRQLMQRLITIQEYLPATEIKKGDIPTYDNWIKFGNSISNLSLALEQTGARPEFARHPFHNLSTKLINADNPFNLMGSIVSHAHSTIQKIETIVHQNNISSNHAAKLTNISNLVQDSVILEDLALSHNLRLVDSSNLEAIEFDQLYQRYTNLKQDYASIVEENKNWKNKFTRNDVKLALELTNKFEKSFFRFLNGNWRKLKKKLNGSYDFAAHQMHPGYGSILEQLQREYDAEVVMSEKKQELQRKYQVSNITTVYLGIDALRRKRGDAEIDYLLQHPKSNELVLQLSKLNNILHQLAIQLQQCLHEYQNNSLSEIKDELATIIANEDVLKDLLPTLKQFASMPPDLQQIIRKIPLTPIQAEALMGNKTLDLLFDKNPQFARIRHDSLSETVMQIDSCYKRLLQLNSDFVRAARRQKFLENYEISNMSLSQLSADKKAFKREYLEGRRILEHEMGKTMRYKSIREMASKESGRVLKDIKPVWLMSPLSVSDSLPLDTSYFDVVIFDEASQITLEEGIPAVYRAPQTIIVGDDKQMPPSNFFSTKGEDPNDLEKFEGESEDEILSSDADSLLVQGARKLGSKMLSWHYRSRYEALISYSNHAFYNAGLLTIPDKIVHYKDRPGIEVQNPQEGAQTAKYLLEGSISFHYLPTSVYEERSNLNEAKYIACIVREALMSGTKDSIGIVAFSQEQQGVIEEAITDLSMLDKQFEEVLEKAYNRMDDGQFTGLFIKNLENVQGDERDIIIMSVCYGHDSNKIMRMNFGPINRRGGEKRLNVIFSRARKHMAVVSSIKYHHITNDYNEGANYFKRFLQYAEMISLGNSAQARAILDGLIPEGARKDVNPKQSEPICAYAIKKALEEKGYQVDYSIGQSAFKCSLAVKKAKNDNEYSLGILIDDDSHYNNTDLIEQYYQRPEILKAFGWKTISVYTKDWLEDKMKVLDSIIISIENFATEQPYSAATVNTRDEKLDKEQNNVNSTRLYSTTTDSFWEVSQSENKLTIRYGKIGSKGQGEIKSFLNFDEASSIKNNLISEKKAIGFTEKQ
jgi:superfamily I DNA and/or RNA helicase/predicted DNA-binding WGR domain protein